ncbi:HlyD family secretion protein [Methylomonas koyamae]|uniref:HlyD family secretion protein n=1 Tax=Methylomonas koyamae TaxID=702114 RepID=UPI0028734BF5|nr:HlyD family efflux transporter periplasmic adaptor subunit [Methylomonas koyamae]WNB77755.1 HlyD family efflux transporter periplasmic adaptor subunit [Methylomonas koyamae]
MKQPLFRQQALDFKKDKPLGEVIRVEALPFSVLTALAVGSAALLIAFAFWGEYTRKSHVSGYLAPSMGLIKVYPPQAGTLIEKHVKEGQAVKAGDTLFVLSTDSSSRDTPQAQAAAIEQLKQRRESLEAELGQQEHIDRIQYRALLDRLHGMQRELQQVNGEIATQQQRLAGAEATLQRYQQLLPTKFVSAVQAQQKQDEWLDHQAKLQALQRLQMTLERDIRATQLEVDSSQMKFKNQRAAIERSISTLNQNITESESRRNIVITAPHDGTATAILAEQGQNAGTGNPLLSILPAGAELRAQLLVPSSAVGFVETGQTVAIRYQAFPYQRFGSQRGRIVEIAKTLITPKDADLPVTLQEAVYRVTVVLDKQSVQAYRQEIPLQSGMLLDADIWLDHRRLIDWIFEPLYSVAGRV